MSSGVRGGPADSSSSPAQADGEGGVPRPSRPRAHGAGQTEGGQWSGQEQGQHPVPTAGMAPTAGPRRTHLFHQSGARLGGTDARGAASMSMPAGPQGYPTGGMLGARELLRTWGRDGQAQTGGRGREGRWAGSGSALTSDPFQNHSLLLCSAGQTHSRPRSRRPPQTHPGPVPALPGSSEAPALAAPEELISGIFSWTHSAV